MKKQLRSGALLIAAIVCLLVSLGVVAAAVQISLRGHAACRLEQRRQQSLWLLDAGCLRAKERLATSAEYGGERWVLGESLVDFPDSWIEIRVSNHEQVSASEQDGNRPDSTVKEETEKIVEVTAWLAEYAGDSLAIKQSSQFLWRDVEVPSGEEYENAQVE